METTLTRPELTLTRNEAMLAASRSALYSFLARGFAFPSTDLYAEIRKGEYLAAIEQAAQDLPFRIALPGELGNGLDLDYDTFQSIYIALFELGGDTGAAVPLHEGLHGGGLLKDMEEVLRLYHHFGFRYSGTWRPDHIQTELEFMHGLTFAEAAALEQGNDPGVFRRAQADFIRLHLCDIAGIVASEIGGRKAPFYPELSQLLRSFLRADASNLGVMS